MAWSSVVRLLVAERRLAPRGHRAGAPDGRLAFAAAVRVVVRVHHGAADGRPPAHVALAAGLADLQVLVVDVADLAHRGHAPERHVAQLARRQPQQREAVLLGHQLRHDAGRAGELRALAGVQLHIVDEGADRDALQREGVARADVRILAGNDGVAGLEALRRDDIALVAVLILQQGDERAAVGVILDAQHLCGRAELAPLEVDHAVLPAVAAAAVADGDPAVAVAAGMLFLGDEQALLRRLFRQPAVVHDGHVPAGCCRRPEIYGWHFSHSS